MDSSPPLPDRPRVLIIDDDRKLCRLVGEYLAPMGYDVAGAHSGPEGIARAAAESWHALILDVMLPGGLDGFEVLRRIRQGSDVPVLMLTARGEETDARTAVLNDAPLVLTPVEFDLLAALARGVGRVRTRERLLEEIRAREYEVFDRSIDVHISTLRRKLGDNPREPGFIRTVRAAGYMMIAPGTEPV